jgi:hypothetical protein
VIDEDDDDTGRLGAQAPAELVDPVELVAGRVARALTETDPRATINDAFDYVAAVMRAPVNNETKALLGIAGVGALSAWALRGSLSFAPTGGAEPRESEIDDEEALARVIASEVGGRALGGQPYTLAEKVAVAWAVRNRARARRVSIAHLVCSPTCGPQRGRTFSSARPATDETRDIARVVLEAQQLTDPTGGAYSFMEPDQIDRLYLDGAPGYTHDADGVRAQWRADHQRRYGTVGHIELWGRA